jgi:hypothetical protein
MTLYETLTSEQGRKQAEVKRLSVFRLDLIGQLLLVPEKTVDDEGDHGRIKIEAKGKLPAYFYNEALLN